MSFCSAHVLPVSVCELIDRAKYWNLRSMNLQKATLPVLPLELILFSLFSVEPLSLSLSFPLLSLFLVDLSSSRSRSYWRRKEDPLETAPFVRLWITQLEREREREGGTVTATAAAAIERCSGRSSILDKPILLPEPRLLNWGLSYKSIFGWFGACLK